MRHTARNSDLKMEPVVCWCMCRTPVLWRWISIFGPGNISLSLTNGKRHISWSTWCLVPIKSVPKARDFQAELEKNGAYSNATTGVYDITYEAECADFEWDRVLGCCCLAITKPLFLDEEFKAEFGNVEEEMAARSNNHFRRLSLEMRKLSAWLPKLMPNVCSLWKM